MVVDELRSGVTVIRKDGGRVHAAVDPDVGLAQGGRALFRMNGHPPVLTVFDLPAQGEAEPNPRLIRFPEDFDPGYHRADLAVWDAPNQLLLADRYGQHEERASPGLRIDILSGRIERLPEVRGGNQEIIFVRPWIPPRS